MRFIWNLLREFLHIRGPSTTIATSTSLGGLEIPFQVTVEMNIGVSERYQELVNSKFDDLTASDISASRTGLRRRWKRRYRWEEAEEKEEDRPD